MDPVIETELRAIAEGARAQEASARKLAERTERLLATLEEASLEKTTHKKEGDDLPESSLKRPDGRLTEAGVVAINAAFDADETVSQVAKRFKIHVSAAANRRAIWKSKRPKDLS